MTKNFRTDVEFNNSLTASAATTTLGITKFTSLSGTTSSVSGSAISSNIVVSGVTPANLTSRAVYDFSSNSGRFLVWGASVTSPTFTWWLGQGNSSTNQRMSLDASGNLILTNNLTASGGTSTLGATKMSSGSISGSAIATQSYVTGYALNKNVIDNTNVALGTNISSTTVSSSNNVFIGTYAGANFNSNNTSGNHVAIGFNSLGTGGISGVTGDSSVAIGFESAMNVTDASTPFVVIGGNAGQTAAILNNSVLIGPNAATLAPNISRSTIIGPYAVQNTVTDLADTVAIGYNTFRNITTGTFNIGIGHQAGTGLTTGNYNTFIGINTGLATPQYNGTTVLGVSDAGASNQPTGNNQIILGTSAHNVIVSGSTTLGTTTTGLFTATAASVGVNSITTDNLIRGINNTRSNSIETFTRNFSETPPAGTSSTSFFTFFTATDNINFSSITFVANTAGAGVSFFRLGIYSVSNSDQYASTMTLVARTASITSAFTANTASTMVLDTTGGYSSSYSLIKGSRYAIGYLQIATTISTIAGYAPLSALHALPPRISGGSAAQRELSTSYSASLLAGTSVAHWFRLS